MDGKKVVEIDILFDTKLLFCYSGIGQVLR